MKHTSWTLLVSAICLTLTGTAKAGTAVIQEVPEPQPEVALQQAQAAAQAAAAVGTAATQAAAALAVAPVAAVPGIGTDLVILDELINIGKALWDIIALGKPVIDINQDVANAVPKGITDWTQLTNWGNPTSKLYHVSLQTGGIGDMTGDYYFRVVYTGGGSYNGAGKYLTGVSIMPADLTVTYDKGFSAKTIVGTIVNHGTTAQPIAGMDITLQYSLKTFWTNNTNQIAFHVRADSSDVQVLSSPSDQATDIGETGWTPGSDWNGYPDPTY
jgi:hypothetical protein